MFCSIVVCLVSNHGTYWEMIVLCVYVFCVCLCCGCCRFVEYDSVIYNCMFNKQQSAKYMGCSLSFCKCNVGFKMFTRVCIWEERNHHFLYLFHIHYSVQVGGIGAIINGVGRLAWGIIADKVGECSYNYFSWVIACLSLVLIVCVFSSTYIWIVWYVYLVYFLFLSWNIAL